MNSGPASGDRSDAEVIRESLERPEAFEAIFHRHYDHLYRYLVRRVGPDAGADLAATVFERAFADRHRFSGTGSSRPWLYGIAANLIRMRARSASRRKRAWLLLGRRDRASVTYDLGDVDWRIDAEMEVARLGIVDALAELNPADREVLLLRAFADLTYAEIAEALGVPVGTVRSRLNRARRILNARLGERNASTHERIEPEGEP